MLLILRSALVWLLFSTGASANALSERGILSFGYPAEWGDEVGANGQILTMYELAECMRRSLVLDDNLKDLDFDRVRLELAEPMQAAPPKESTGDAELDKMLDLQDAADSSFDEKLRDFIVRRQQYLIDRIAFDQQCNTRPYRTEDVLTLTRGRKT